MKRIITLRPYTGHTAQELLIALGAALDAGEIMPTVTLDLAPATLELPGLGEIDIERERRE